uniref:Uncharacterized protein n=1 Tax=Romanomermis culicivorax TaxID=13658 RepID=A0A915LCR0_ROMCU
MPKGSRVTDDSHELKKIQTILTTRQKMKPKQPEKPTTNSVSLEFHLLRIYSQNGIQIGLKFQQKKFKDSSTCD